MWIKKLLLVIVFSTSPGSLTWIHDGKIVGFDLVEKSILPVSYFYVQIIDVYGRNITDINDNQQSHLTFTITGDCRRFSADKIYTGDGLFILRIKVFEECKDIEVNVKFLGSHISTSPLCIPQLIPENCRCPRDMNLVMESLNCPAHNHQITQDLKPFANIDFVAIKEQIKQRFKNFKSSSLCNYIVKKNVIHRKCFGQYTGFSMFMDAVMVSLTNKVFLPDLEFFINLGDWPLIKKSSAGFPIFSWCGSTETLDIVLPTYELTEATINMLHRVVLDVASIQTEKFTWEQKINKAFFRGRDSRRERLDLIDISRKHPKLFNASITNFFFFTDEIDKYGPKVSHIPMPDFFKYKYQISIDGTVAAYRLPYLLAGNSVLLKQDSPYYENYYHKLRPFEHYIPYHRDPKLDLVEKVEWLRVNDDEAKKIMRNARNFARENLMPRDVYCYYLLLLKNYSEKISSPIEVTDDMERVDTKSKECRCIVH